MCVCVCVCVYIRKKVRIGPLISIRAPSTGEIELLFYGMFLLLVTLNHVIGYKLLLVDKSTLYHITAC